MTSCAAASILPKCYCLETDVLRTIEECHAAIDSQLSTVFQMAHTRVYLVAADLLKKQWRLDEDDFTSMLLGAELDQAIQKLQKFIQFKLQECFGVISVELLSFQQEKLAINLEVLQLLMLENQLTFTLAKGIQWIASHYWDQAIDCLNLSFGSKKLLGHFSLVDQYLYQTGAHPDCHAKRAWLQLATGLKGLLVSMEKQLYRRLSQLTAQIFYQIYDDLKAS